MSLFAIRNFLLDTTSMLSAKRLSAFFLLCPMTLSAQSLSSTVWFKISDDIGRHDSLVFGNHVNGTYCIDFALGENLRPPIPPGWCVEFTSIPGRTNCFGTGIIEKNLYDAEPRFPTRKDTFDLEFANFDSVAEQPFVSVTLRWPDSSYLAERCDSMFMVDRDSGAVISGRIDMLARDGVVLTGVYDPSGRNPTAPFAKLRIFKWGLRIVDEVKRETILAPKGFLLAQNYPNPFNPSTSIRFAIPEYSLVRLQVFNLLGQSFQMLVNEAKQPGTYEVTWDATNRPSGLYFYRLTAGSFVQTKTALLLK